jgi:diacylglycerol kinase (ATP)
VSPNRTLILVNPAAGRGQASRIYPAVAKYLQDEKQNVKFALPASEAEFRAAAIEGAQKGYATLVALGGDGAFHHLVNSCFGCHVNFGLIPAGNGNDIAMGLGLPRDPIEAAHTLLSGRPAQIDVVRVRLQRDGGLGVSAEPEQKIFVGVGGVGLDAEAAQLANTRFRRWPGAARYILGAFSARRHSRGLEVSAEIDGENWQGKVMFAALANGPRYGAGIQIAADARMNDGYLNAAFVGEVPLSKLIEAIPIVMQGNLRWPEVKRFRGGAVKIQTNQGALIHGDGEILGYAPAEFAIISGAIRVIVPPSFGSSSPSSFSLASE